MGLNDERKKFRRMFRLILNTSKYINMKSYQNIACIDFVEVCTTLSSHAYEKTRGLY